MITLSIKNHLGVMISSIDKVYKKAQISGKLEIKDVYYLNLIFKLLNKVELNNNQNNQLINYYNNLSFYSENICPPKVIKKYQTTPKPKFEQTEREDCNTYPENNNILYWQETYLLDTTDIKDLVVSPGYLLDKASDTILNFNNGRYIDYNKIGKIVFVILNSGNNNYIIKDYLNAEVTHAFDRNFIQSLNSILFTSKENHTHGTMKFKIQKQ